MADAPEVAFSADERFPKYPLHTDEEAPTSTQTQDPREEKGMDYLPSDPSNPKSLPPIAAVSPWNYASPPQYAVDTPATETAPPSHANAFAPVAISGGRQDTMDTFEEQRLRSQMTMARFDGGEVEGAWRAGGGEKWRVPFWGCFSEKGLCCEAVWCPCLVGGRTHQRVNGVEERRLSSLSGYVCVLLCSVEFLCLDRAYEHTFANRAMLVFCMLLPCDCLLWSVDSDDYGTPRY